MSSRKYKQGDIILVPYPYTDLSGFKKRPVIIISNDNYQGENYIVAKITSVIRNDKFSFLLQDEAIKGRLAIKSEVKTDELFTLHESIILRSICSLKKRALESLIQRIIQNLQIP